MGCNYQWDLHRLSALQGLKSIAGATPPVSEPLDPSKRRYQVSKKANPLQLGYEIAVRDGEHFATLRNCRKVVDVLNQLLELIDWDYDSGLLPSCISDIFHIEMFDVQHSETHFLTEL